MTDYTLKQNEYINEDIPVWPHDDNDTSWVSDQDTARQTKGNREGFSSKTALSVRARQAIKGMRRQRVKLDTQEARKI